MASFTNNFQDDFGSHFDLFARTNFISYIRENRTASFPRHSIHCCERRCTRAPCILRVGKKNPPRTFVQCNKCPYGWCASVSLYKEKTYGRVYGCVVGMFGFLLLYTCLRTADCENSPFGTPTLNGPIKFKRSLQSHD